MNVEQPLFVLIGNADNRRTQDWRQACAAIGGDSPVFLSYADLLRGLEAGRPLGVLLRQASAQAVGQRRLLVRLDAPGEDEAVQRALIAWGADDFHQQGSSEAFGWELAAPQASACLSREARRMALPFGEMAYPAQWYRGLCRLLQRLEQEANEQDLPLQWWHAPRDIAIMFDKRRCQQHLLQAGVCIPEPVPATFGDADHLRAWMDQHRVARLFIKLAYGSGAGGVLAYQRQRQSGREQAHTSLVIEEQHGRRRVFQSKRVRRCNQKQELDEMLNWLIAEGMQAERWVEKWHNGIHSADFRQLVVGGQAAHRIARLSRSPITNLHLGNKRMYLEEMDLAEQTIAQIEQAAVAVMACFPRSYSAGIDVVLQHRTLQTFIIDVNPFGDLLHRVIHNGADAYEWMLRKRFNLA